MTNPTDTNQASESELERKIEQCFIDNNMCDCGGEHTSLSLDETEFFDIEAVVKDIKQLIRNEKLKLLAEVRERVVDKPTGNHNADSLLERDVLIYNQATAYLRTELTKLEALAELKFKKEEV